MSAVYGWFDISFKKEDGTPDGEMAKKVCESLLEQYSAWVEEQDFGLECDEEKGQVWVVSEGDGFYTKHLDYNDTEFQKTIFETFKPAKMISKVTCDHTESDGRIDYWYMVGTAAKGEIRVSDYYELRYAESGYYGSDSGSDSVILFDDDFNERRVHVHCKDEDGEEYEDDCIVHTELEDDEPTDLCICTDYDDMYLLNADGEHITDFYDFDSIEYPDGFEEIK